MTENNRKFLIYLISYLGVAMIGGSIVHMGTLDQHAVRYAILGIIGLGLMLVGNILEAKLNQEPINLKYVGLVSALALATGFLSGGIQHYLDNPLFAGSLLGIGLVVAYLTFAKKYHFATTQTGVVTVVVIGLVIILGSVIVHDLIPPGLHDHHH